MLILICFVDLDDVRVVEKSHDFELIDQGCRIFDSPFGNAFDNSGSVWENSLPDLIDYSIGTSPDFLHPLELTFRKSKWSLI